MVIICFSGALGVKIIKTVPVVMFLTDFGPYIYDCVFTNLDFPLIIDGQFFTFK
jgi:hypothetical protein